MQRISRRGGVIAATLFLLGFPTGGIAQDSSSAAIRPLLAMVTDSCVRVSILSLQSFGSRYSYDANREDVARWVSARFRGYGLTDVQPDSFLQSGLLQTNIVATIPGTLLPEKEIILGAHTDSYSFGSGPAPGADDNASGVAAIIEIARVLRVAGYRPAVTIRFIGFAAEEIGLRGSRSYAFRARGAQRQILAMLNFDMIAHHNRSQALNQFNLVWYSGAESLARLDSAMAATYTSLTPVLTTTARNGSDSYAFFEQGYPAIFHYERGANAGYHTPADILDSLDLPYAAEIIRSALATLLTLDARSAGTATVPTMPESFALLQNYPNPFNPATGTQIMYDVPAPAIVRLEVFDLLGRRVALLADGFHPPGRHTRSWTPSQLPTGVYFLRMGWNDGSVIRRMMLVR